MLKKTSRKSIDPERVLPTSQIGLDSAKDWAEKYVSDYSEIDKDETLKRRVIIKKTVQRDSQGRISAVIEEHIDA